MGFREKMKRALFSSHLHPFTMAKSSKTAKPSSRLAVRLEEAREHTTGLPKGQKQASPAARQREVTPTPTSSQTAPARSFTKSVRSSIIKSLTFRRPSKRKTEEQWPKIELYKAHEVPRPKYRGPVDRKHMASLAAYTIVTATKLHRRRSIDSHICPLDTQTPSRAESAGDAHSLAATTITRRPGDADESSQDEDSNATSILSSDGGVNISSSTLLTSHSHSTEEEQHPRWPETRLKRTTAFTATDLHDALDAIET
ncbi:uncharacterized protein GIQ15_05338 [Arthroderma uncinatum]|uniref:uncharacterized protein n=1 Tax=Arthroderma uncinatum TaxID=74035 RepID=UPI00144A9167|nr:uncharacterized protein GIQ15_05338 [Arthroderma uncinatum]KAF3482579.1 hypothetical protein GIQ15_05338 [Arthroderma uncinatum]